MYQQAEAGPGGLCCHAAGWFPPRGARGGMQTFMEVSGPHSLMVPTAVQFHRGSRIPGIILAFGRNVNRRSVPAQCKWVGERGNWKWRWISSEWNDHCGQERSDPDYISISLFPTAAVVLCITAPLLGTLWQTCIPCVILGSANQMFLLLGIVWQRR